MWDINELHFQTFSIPCLPLKMPRYFFGGAMDLLGMLGDHAETFDDFTVLN